MNQIKQLVSEYKTKKIAEIFDKLDSKQDPLQKASAIKRMMKVTEDFSSVIPELCAWVKQELEKRRYELNKIL